MNGKHEDIREAAGGPFDDELDLFLATGRIAGRPARAGAVARRVRRRKVRNDRVFRGALGTFGVVALTVSLWLGYGMDRTGMAGAESEPGDAYVEIYVMEDLFSGAEALADDDLLDTLDFLMGG